jgi:hypothetical protein
MPRLFKKDLPWLLVFAGGNGDEEEHIWRYMEMASRIGLALPNYKTRRISPERTLNFPTGVPAKNELAELFSETILNDLIKHKNKTGAAQTALIVARNAFPDADVFKAVVKDGRNENSIYHLICTWTNFLKFEPRTKCYESSCVQCENLGEGCLHSCLPRLFWLMFNKNDRVLKVFEE